MTLNVADLSNNNGSTSLSSYPADAYIFKATEGNYFVDKHCDTYVQQAIKAGKPWGIYHFLDNRSDVITQAKFFIANCKSYFGHCIIALDYEAYGMVGVAKAKQWLDYVYKHTGVRPLMYMSASVTLSEDWSSVVKANYGLWVAAYPYSGKPTKMPKIGYWSAPTLWQYTSSPYDKSVFYGDKAAWTKYAGAKPAAVSKPKPAKKAAPGPVKHTITTKLRPATRLGVAYLHAGTQTYTDATLKTKSKRLAKGTAYKIASIKPGALCLGTGVWAPVDQLTVRLNPLQDTKQHPDVYTDGKVQLYKDPAGKAKAKVVADDWWATFGLPADGKLVSLGSGWARVADVLVYM